MVLHADEGGKLVRNSVVLHDVDCVRSMRHQHEVWDGRTLPGEAAAHANVSHLAALDNIVESLHSLLDWRVVVEAVAYAEN